MAQEIDHCYHEIDCSDFMSFANVSTLARPLEDYRNSQALVTIVLHALTAHEDAWVKAKILHRDISCGNIMFVVDQEQATETELYGILNDWDLCKHERDLALEQTQNGRSGTWAYMSGVSLKYPLKPYRLSDDLEAFIHVTTFSCLRFHWHDMSHLPLQESYKPGEKLSDAELRNFNNDNKELGEHVAIYYHACYQGGLTGRGVDSGGKAKMIYAKAGQPGWKLTDAPRPLKVLVKSLFKLMKRHYKTINFRKLDKHYARARVGTLSTIGEDSSSDDDDTNEEATSADPFTKKPNPGKDLNTHSRIMSIFEGARNDLRRIQAEGLGLNDKSPDQFLGLREWYDDPPRDPSGSRRLASTRASTSHSSANAENLWGADSPTVQAGMRRKSGTEDISTLPTKISRTSEQRSVGKSAQSEDVEGTSVSEGVVGEPESEEES